MQTTIPFVCILDGSLKSRMFPVYIFAEQKFTQVYQEYLLVLESFEKYHSFPKQRP